MSFLEFRRFWGNISRTGERSRNIDASARAFYESGELYWMQ